MVSVVKAMENVHLVNVVVKMVSVVLPTITVWPQEIVKLDMEIV